MTIRSAARRIAGKEVRRPPSPVVARDSYPSMVFSLYDQTPPPSPRLIEVTLTAVERIVRGEVDLSDLAARPNVPHWFSTWPGEFYHLLAALVQVLQPRQIVEVGTCTGLSALALGKYLPPGSAIATFDLWPWQAVMGTVLTEADFADGRLTQHLCNLANPASFERHREMLTSCDLFVVDGPKDNVFEYRFTEHLRTLQPAGRPLVLYDDIRLWSMLRFWRLLPLPKLDVTSFASWSGSGLAELVV